MSWNDFDDYQYVPVAERRRRALRKMDRLREEGREIQPIEPFKTRGIATSFWGKAWCRHLEKFSDYSNRLPRGRTYVRNGSVCHLGIEPETAKAMVSGSEMYELSIHIEPLDPAKWDAIKNRCRGKIGSLIELLQGKISDEIMEIVTDKENGLFPHPKEIRFNCNCPDWADMCKHIAAAMYGIGVRLDTEPELLFKLRGVNHEELIAVDAAIDDLTAGRSSRRRRTLADDAVATVFGVDLEEESAPPSPPTFEPSAACVRDLREQLGLSQRAFAARLGVSAASVKNWENADGPLNLQAQSRAALETLF
uniref:helix-turn-helix domain-containing protein n=1 Tax=Pontiella sp. TaxID=2837462 RepID=UPI0035626D75